MSYTTQVITLEKDFFALKDDWQTLQKDAVVSEIFQTFSFLSTWWQTFQPGKLQIITVRSENNELLAVAPLYEREENGKTILHLLGCVNVSDYLDVLVHKSLQEDLYPLLLEAIQKLAWNTLFFCSLPESSPSREWLKKYFVEQTVAEAEQDICPFIELPGDWESYLQSLDRKQRHEIRRKMRRLETYKHTFEIVTKPSEKDISDFIELHKASSKDKREFWDDNHMQFFQKVLPELAAEGCIRLFFLSASEVRAATMLVFAYNNQFQLYNSGFLLDDFRELSVGSLLTAHTIEQAITEKMSVYDFLRGNEAYKFRYTKTAKPIFDITISRDHQTAKPPQ